MTIYPRYSSAVLLGLSAALLISLVPGGPIENRDFSHISPLILTAFNVFLTVLGIGSLLLIPLCLKRFKVAGTLSMFVAASYLVVYLIDLFAIFPQTPTPMSQALFSVEVLGSIVSLPLLWAGWQLRCMNTKTTPEAKLLTPRQTALLILVSVAIVIFATWSAMHSAT